MYVMPCAELNLASKYHGPRKVLVMVHLEISGNLDLERLPKNQFKAGSYFTSKYSLSNEYVILSPWKPMKNLYSCRIYDFSGYSTQQLLWQNTQRLSSLMTKQLTSRLRIKWGKSSVKTVFPWCLAEITPRLLAVFLAMLKQSVGTFPNPAILHRQWQCYGWTPMLILTLHWPHIPEICTAVPFHFSWKKRTIIFRMIFRALSSFVHGNNYWLQFFWYNFNMKGVIFSLTADRIAYIGLRAVDADE